MPDDPRTPSAEPGVPGRFLADEMVGRLARYLRFLGYDVEYVRGRSDDEVAAWARRDRRVLLTRDAELARRVEGSLWIRSADIREQLKETAAQWPPLLRSATFDRCTACNGRLRQYDPSIDPPLPPHVPRSRCGNPALIFRCPRCGRFYWEGSHRARLLRDLDAWLGERR